MKHRYPRVSLEYLCGLFGYRRQTYYKKTNHLDLKAERANVIVEKVKALRCDQSQLGVRKLQYMINNSEMALKKPVGRDELYDLLRSRGLLIRKRKRYRPAMTNGNGESIYPDFRKGLFVNRVNQLWSSDITYFAA